MMIDSITAPEPDIPDPAQLNLLDCFFDDQEPCTPQTLLPGVTAEVEANIRDPTVEGDDPFSFNNEQIEFARILREKSRALACKNRNTDNDE